MPNAWHSPEVKARAIDLWRGLGNAGEPRAAWDVALILSTTVTDGLAREVSERSAQGWITAYQENGYSEGQRQHESRVHSEATVLHKRTERVDKMSVDVQEALINLIEHNPTAYGRELQPLLHHLTGAWVVLDDIWALRKHMYFSCCRLGRPMCAADPILQNMYKHKCETHQFEDWQCDAAELEHARLAHR